MEYRLRLKKRVIQSISTRKSPCNKFSKGTCIRRQIFRHFAGQFNCKIISNSNGLYLRDLDPEEIPYCNETIHKNFAKQYKDLLTNAKKKCPGIQSCHRAKYDFDLREIYLKNQNHTTLKIMMFDPIVEYSIDFISYDFQSLIGEIGGTLGLTIGLSFFSFAEWIIGLIHYFTKRF